MRHGAHIHGRSLLSQRPGAPPAGYMPVRLQALPEGSVVHAHVPTFQLTAEEPYAPLCTYLETLLTHVWYPTTVATLRHVSAGAAVPSAHPACRRAARQAAGRCW